MGGKSDYKKIMILCAVLAVGIIVISVIFALNSDRKDGHGTGKTVEGNEVTEVPHEQPDITCMILDVDLDASTITLKNLENGEKTELIYTGGSDIRTKSGRLVSAAMLKKGNIAKVKAGEDGKLLSLIGADNVWTYKNVENMKVYADQGKIEVGSSIYHMDDGLEILNGEDFTGKDSLLIDGTDILDLYGIGDRVYLIKVNTGHGYLTLENIESFDGGTVYYGLGRSASVDDELRLTLREGDYAITVVKDDLTAEATVRIKRDEDTCFDLLPFSPEPVEYGEVKLNISPKESELYIDGVKTDNIETLSLPVGVHDIEVSLGGYNSYKGTIDVGTAGVTKSISLSEAPEEVPDDIIYEETTPETVTVTPAATATPKPTASDVIPDDSTLPADSDIPDSTSDNGNDGNIDVVDGDDGTPTASPGSNTGSTGHGKMTVYSTDGASVYVDGVYKGDISGGSLTFDKPSGTISLELKKSGYVTKKYTLTMDDDEEEQVFRFPEMTKS
ncbi:MAG: PEGA domain-containing protein [Lachnospiraceae bacterium]|nr:PEGA domain-containing protein [Lachnospiraceae bacterium]MCR4991677.1 PEGA domain-containing protein [Lachnospiraceae bacterium]